MTYKNTTTSRRFSVSRRKHRVFLFLIRSGGLVISLANRMEFNGAYEISVCIITAIGNFGNDFAEARRLYTAALPLVLFVNVRTVTLCLIILLYTITMYSVMYTLTECIIISTLLHGVRTNDCYNKWSFALGGKAYGSWRARFWILRPGYFKPVYAEYW